MKFSEFDCARCKRPCPTRTIPKTWATMIRADLHRDKVLVEFVLCDQCLPIVKRWLETEAQS